jgi:hypothetical protein
LGSRQEGVRRAWLVQFAEIAAGNRRGFGKPRRDGAAQNATGRRHCVAAPHRLIKPYQNG